MLGGSVERAGLAAAEWNGYSRADCGGSGGRLAAVDQGGRRDVDGIVIVYYYSSWSAATEFMQDGEGWGGRLVAGFRL